MRELAKEFQVGVITKPHGLKGEVNVFPTTEDPGRFRELEEVILVSRDGKSRQTCTIEHVHFVKKFVIVKFKGFDSIESVERYRSCPLMVPREMATPLAEGEYYISDMIGIAVIDEETGKELGHVKDVIKTGANDVYEMTDADGKSIMIPAIKDCIRSIDVENGVMHIHVMKGLLDL